MSNDLVLAAFQETPLNAANPDRAYEVDASLKDAFKKAGIFANKIKGKLKKKLANYHTHEVHKHENALKSAKPNTNKHLYHDTMSKFHRMRLSHAISGGKNKIHKTVHPSKIDLQHNKKGEPKAPASRAEQAAHQHHQEQANNLAHAHNELKEKGFHKAAENVAHAHHDEAAKAKSIESRRSMPETKKVKLNKEHKEPEKKSGRGSYTRTDKHKQAIKDAKEEKKAVVSKGRAKAYDITTRKPLTEKNMPAIRKARKEAAKAKEKGESKKVEKVAEEKPAVKRRGRPAGSKNKPKVEKTVKEEKPAKKAAVKKAPAKKTVKKAPEEKPAAKKRGRPAGSKNKPKAA